MTGVLQVEGAPEIFDDSSYSGMDSGGVTALLEAHHINSCFKFSRCFQSFHGDFMELLLFEWDCLRLLDLEVLQADFVRMETETETAEAGAVVTLKREAKRVQQRRSKLEMR